MRIAKFLISLFLTLALIYFLDNRWMINNQAIPPFGKILDPFHGFWNNIESKSAEKSEELDLPGLKDKVTIMYDSLLIPHIFAQNEADLFYAQGYVTAQHRLWQMEFLTYAAAGRVSEFVQSDAAFDFDRKQRRLGMGYGAEKAIEMMMQDEKTNMIITNYAAGVNDYIKTLSYRDYPLEYKLLHYAPEPWTPIKVGYMLKNLSQTLNLKETDVEMTNALKLLGRDMVELLYAENDRPFADPIVDNPGNWKFTPIALDSIPLALPAEYIAQPVMEKTQGIGSNNWAVHGSRTATGAPLLCNDPHLTLSLPSIWFVVHLNAPGLNTMGATFPGVPLVVLGWNDSVAWGCTNAERDVADWFKVRFRDKTNAEYYSDGQWKKSTQRIETFNVRGKGVMHDTVVYTHHGPLVYDETFHSENERNHYAFRWIAHDGSNELRAIYDYNRAHNHAEFINALSYWQAPAQNFVFASVEGDVAMHVQGKFPVRRRNEGKFVLDGTTTKTEWKAFIPQEQNIFYKNPARGFVSSANQFPVDGTYPYYVHAQNYESFRNRRINEVLSKLTKATPRDMMTLQNDAYNLPASESLPLMLTMVDIASLKGNGNRIAETLSYWDFINSRESLAASYYDAWWHHFVTLLFDEFQSPNMAFDVPSDAGIIRIMKTQAEFALYDRISTPEKESLADLIKTSFQMAVDEINKWEHEKQRAVEWGAYKDTQINHYLRLDPLSAHVDVGGSRLSVNAISKTKGPSWRYIVSLEKPALKIWGIYPGGQSGNPGSRFYDNFIRYWGEGNYYPMAYGSTLSAIEKQAMFTTTFTPED
jgi:penicillin G amidase